jgi:HSP20 family protein
MNLIQWEPFRELMPAAWRRWPALSDDFNGKAGWTPSADISETDTEYLIRAELPSVKKEDVKVTIENGMIAIEGERKYEKEVKNEKFHRVESCPKMPMTRRFTLKARTAC